MYSIGIDIGSTTAKMVLLSQRNELLSWRYVRHFAQIGQTLASFLEDLQPTVGDTPVKIAVTGSAAMGVAERMGLPFIQELVASASFVRQHAPQVRTLIDMGGEDTKLILFEDRRLPDIRMNGNCAGGTGAFIDQMADLLHVTPEAFDRLAAAHQRVFPIASRCGVFAKTDVQNLLSRKVSHADIAASVYYAVAMQSMNTLARGYDVIPKILFTGGPFTFLPTLSQVFLDTLHMTNDDRVRVDHPELVPALGAAWHAASQPAAFTVRDVLHGLHHAEAETVQGQRLAPLFPSEDDFRQWQQERPPLAFNRVLLSEYTGNEVFMGVDSGSTTTKIVMLGDRGELLYHFYAPNQGQPVETVQRGLIRFKQQMEEAGKNFRVAYSVSTGYGEDLIRSAFSLQEGMVETLAHYMAASHFDPEVSFILDIGGQDMKAFFIRNRQVQRIELNESCSSGCGSFIETFSNSLGYSVSEFAQLACQATAPFDLGSRCTVFMNSRVKQALRENAAVQDIAAGLSYSVIRNALYKVLKINNISDLGDHLMVQGGTFRNPSVRRAFELLTGRSTRMTELPEMMGAYGAARYGLQAVQHMSAAERADLPVWHWESVDEASEYTSVVHTCKGCTNQCVVSELRFRSGRRFYSGNKCEQVFHNHRSAVEHGENLSAYKTGLLFGPPTPASLAPGVSAPAATALASGESAPSCGGYRYTVGIPRALHMYDKMVFWRTLLESAGMRVVLSSPSTTVLYRKGIGSIMSDNICFPAKMMHGHVVDLMEKHVDRILYPMAFYEQPEHQDAANTYNCPIVSSYADVLRSAVNPMQRSGIPLDAPSVNYADSRLLKDACCAFLRSLGVSSGEARHAFRQAVQAQMTYKLKLRLKAGELIEKVLRNGGILIVLAGRPYHADSLINSKIPDILTELGAHVITEDMVPEQQTSFASLRVLPQWSYVNRIYAAAMWVAAQPFNVQMVQINSFGCGPDAIAIDEVRAILRSSGKYLTVVRVDEISSTGSIRLRLRSMMASLRQRQRDACRPLTLEKRPDQAVFTLDDKTRRFIVAPDLAPLYTPLLRPIFAFSGYTYVQLPEPDRGAVQMGLQYADNEICYPATIIVGDLIRAVKSGRFPREQLALGITQTCGQCRASSYLSLIKKALLAAGYADIPVISLGTEGKVANSQPGFTLKFLPILREVIHAMLSADMLMKMRYAVTPREKQPGEAARLAALYLERIEDRFMHRDPSGMFDEMRRAVSDFNAVPIYDKVLTKVGIVGEIFVKYNAFANGHIVDWLHAHDMEAILPPLTDFFIQTFVNRRVNQKSYLQRSSVLANLLSGALFSYVSRCVREANTILSSFRFYDPFHAIHDMADMASDLVSLENQFGEGWLIPAEIVLFAKTGVTRVVSVQPFGCIANQIVSKGIEKRIRARFPEMNLLFLDYDSSVSEVNVQNRLHFL